eukprot:c23656_g1_i2 orf=1072-2754(+)
MGRQSPSAFSNGSHHNCRRRSWPKLTDDQGSVILSKSPSRACIRFASLSELGLQSHNDVQTDHFFTVGSTSNFARVPSDDHDYVLEPPIAVQRSASNLQAGLLTLPMAWKSSSESRINLLVHGFTKLASWVDFMQAGLMQHGQKHKHQFSFGMPVLEGQKQGLLFCSVGLAGREIGGVEKLNLSQAEASLVSHNHLNEKDNGSIDSHLLSNEDASRSLSQIDAEAGIKDVSESSAFVTVKHLSAGAISAIVSRTFVAPLERLKLEYMVRGAQQNVLQIIQMIVAKEGVKGFWRGNTVNLLRTAPFKSVNFFCYDVYRKKLLEITGKKEVSNFERLFAGAAAGISATLLCFPMDTIRTRMVAPGGEALGGVIGCFQYMLRTEGFFSLYKGLLPAVISMAPSGAVFYGVYDILKTSYLQSPEGQEDLRSRIEIERRRRGIVTKVPGDTVTEISETNLQADLKEEAGNLGQLELGPIRTLVYGAIAGICAETVTYPFEVVRRQLQMQNAANKMGALATCQGLVQRGGVGALYSGLLPSSLQVLPSAAISYFVYECMKVLFKVP